MTASPPISKIATVAAQTLAPWHQVAERVCDVAKNFPINIKLIVTFCVLMGVCLLASAVVFWQTLGSEHVTVQNNKANNILHAVDGATAAMLEQAVNQRGFLLFRSDSTYNDVFAQRDLMLKKLGEARALAAGQPDILKSIDDMQASATVFFKELAEPQLAARKTTEAPISEIIEIGRNQAKGQLDGFRASAAKIKDQLNGLSASYAAQQDAAALNLKLALLGGGAVAGLLAVALIWALSRSIVTPIVGMTAAMSRLADGDMTTEVPALDRKDEVGKMAKAVLVFKEAGLEKSRLAGETERMRSATETERRRNEEEKAQTKPPTPLRVTSLARVLRLWRKAISPTVSKRRSPPTSTPSVSTSTALSKSCSRPCAPLARMPLQSMPGLRKCSLLPTTCRAAPNSRPLPSRKPPQHWKKSPPRCATAQGAEDAGNLVQRARSGQKNPASWFARRLPPCARSKNHQAKSAISSASSTISLSRPTCLR